MGIFNWFNVFKKNSDGTISITDSANLTVDVFYKRLAIETCIDLISNALVRCEFQTFLKGEEVRGENHYLFNVSPNQNQNASEFIHSMVNHLFKNNECLVVMHNDYLYVADDYEKKEYALYENIYESVTIGDFTFDKSFNESEVIYLKLNDNNIAEVIDGLYASYGKLLSSAMNYYKRKNNKRLLVTGDFLRSQTDETQAALNTLLERQLADYFNPDKEGVAFQAPKGYEIQDKSDNLTAANANTSRDVRDLVDDIFDIVATAFHVPMGLLKGDLANVESQIDAFLMFRINPLAELIADEFNRKMYTKKDHAERTGIKVDTSNIKILDIVKLSTALDKYFAIGVNTINDNLKLLNRQPVNDPLANTRFVTKNYQSLHSLEGGETKGEE